MSILHQTALYSSCFEVWNSRCPRQASSAYCPTTGALSVCVTACQLCDSCHMMLHVVNDASVIITLPRKVFISKYEKEIQWQALLGCKHNSTMWQSHDWCFDIVLFISVETKHVIVSLTQKQTPQIYCLKQESRGGEGFRAPGRQRWRTFVVCCSSDYFHLLLDSLCLPRGHMQIKNNRLCVYYTFFSKNLSANNIVTISCAPVESCILPFRNAQKVLLHCISCTHFASSLTLRAPSVLADPRKPWALAFVNSAGLRPHSEKTAWCSNILLCIV